MIYDVVVLGSCSVDFTSYAPRLPIKGETLHGTKFSTSYGGKGANQCVAAAKLGAKTALIARLGDDDWGCKYKRYLDKENVETKHTYITKNNSSGIAQIVVSDSGDNQIVIVSGANGLITENDVAESRGVIENAAVLVCQMETPLVATEAALRLCNGISILNVAPARKDLTDTFLQIPSIVCVNEPEAATLVGKDVYSLSDAAEAISCLIQRGCKCVLITMGGEGAVFASQEDHRPIFVPCKKVRPVDTTGAGDAFIGALAYLTALDSSQPLHQRVGIACAAATHSVTVEGTQTSFLTSLPNIKKEDIIWKYL